MKKNLYLFVLLFFVAGSVFAQAIKVSGIVTTGNGKTLPGVSILIQGTTQGTITDLHGRYSIEVNKGAVLQFSYIGFDTQKITVGNSTVINVVMKSGVSLNEVVVTGTRFGGRTALETAVPVDIINVKAIKTVASQTGLAQLMSYAIPSFTSNVQAIEDGTDEVDPASLRGLAPNQVLVLINGKRRHPSSLINIAGSSADGGVGTDLNAIPAEAIQSIQVLRDGASAQYGSDAIAGVINIILKKNTHGLSYNITQGTYASKNSNALTGGLDGPSTNISANYGVGIGKKGGFINLTGEFSYRDYYNRMKSFTGNIFNGYNAIEWQAHQAGAGISNLSLAQLKQYSQLTSVFSPALKSQINSAGSIDAVRSLLEDSNGNPIDFTDAELTERGQTRADYKMVVGQSAIRGGKLFANMSIPVGKHGTEIYAFAGASYRNGNDPEFYRLPDQARTYTPMYINGFLPHLLTDIRDKSLTMGIKGKSKGWNIDFSNTYGGNSMRYTVVHSSNASQLSASRTSFDAGGFASSQSTTNLDVNKHFANIMSGLDVAYGAEFRLESYQVFAGEEASYATYDTLGQPITSSHQVAPVDFFGRSRPGGAQVFPGFQPANELLKYRNSIAGYADVEANFSKKFMLDGAIRYENYSDFGSTINGKLAGRYSITKDINLRASVNTGFRAPSLQQMYFNSTSTLTSTSAALVQVGLFSNDSKVAHLLGIPKLKQEVSQSISVGFTANIPALSLKMTVDGYFIAIQNRIVLTGQFSATTPNLVPLFHQAGAKLATFFTNAIDTHSRGLDIVLENNLILGEHVHLKNTLSGTFSRTIRVGDIHASKILEESGQADVYFGKLSKIYLESTTPHTKINLSNLLSVKNWYFFLRNNYFGSTTSAVDPDFTQIFSPKVITDFSVGYNFTHSLSITLGASNIFDVYPDRALAHNTLNGRFLWAWRSIQFGTGGRYIFASLRFNM